MESVVVETRRARGARACGLTRTDGGGASELCSGQGRTPSRRRADRPAYCGEQRCAARERGSPLNTPPAPCPRTPAASTGLPSCQNQRAPSSRREQQCASRRGDCTRRRTRPAAVAQLRSPKVRESAWPPFSSAHYASMVDLPGQEKETRIQPYQLHSKCSKERPIPVPEKKQNRERVALNKITNQKIPQLSLTDGQRGLSKISLSDGPRTCVSGSCG